MAVSNWLGDIMHQWFIVGYDAGIQRYQAAHNQRLVISTKERRVEEGRTGKNAGKCVRWARAYWQKLDSTFDAKTVINRDQVFTPPLIFPTRDMADIGHLRDVADLMQCFKTSWERGYTKCQS